MNNPALVKILSLKKEYEWFLSEEFKKLREDFTPVDNRKSLDQPDPEGQQVKQAKEAEGVAGTTYNAAKAKAKAK
jgi:hypothetical protein